MIWPSVGRTPELFRLLAIHLAVGVAAGWTVLAALLAMNVAGLRTLITRSPDGPLALTLLAVFFALTFGSVGMGMGVITAHRQSDNGRGPDS